MPMGHNTSNQGYEYELPSYVYTTTTNSGFADATAEGYGAASGLDPAIALPIRNDGTGWDGNVPVDRQRNEVDDDWERSTLR